MSLELTQNFIYESDAQSFQNLLVFKCKQIFKKSLTKIFFWMCNLQTHTIYTFIIPNILPKRELFLTSAKVLALNCASIPRDSLVLPCKWWGVMASQLDLLSLMPLSIAGYD